MNPIPIPIARTPPKPHHHTAKSVNYFPAFLKDAETLTLSRDANTDDKVIYIDVPETSQEEYASMCKQEAEAEGREFIRVEGDIRLIRQLVEGSWNEEEFLIVEPGQRIRAVYDWEKIIRVGE